MKDEIMAKEFAEKECCATCKNINHFCKEKCECWTFAMKGFLAGLKAKTQRHDLQKDPNDLPKRNNEYTDRSDVVITDKGIAHYNFRKQKWYVHNLECDMSFSEGVIAWCEIPTFDKE